MCKGLNWVRSGQESSWQTCHSDFLCRRETINKTRMQMNGFAREARNWRWIRETMKVEDVNFSAYIDALENGSLDAETRRILIIKEGKIQPLTYNVSDFNAMSVSEREHLTADCLVVQVPPLQMPVETRPYDCTERHNVYEVLDAATVQGTHEALKDFHSVCADYHPWTDDYKDTLAVIKAIENGSLCQHTGRYIFVCDGSIWPESIASVDDTFALGTIDRKFEEFAQKGLMYQVPDQHGPQRATNGLRNAIYEPRITEPQWWREKAAGVWRGVQSWKR